MTYCFEDLDNPDILALRPRLEDADAQVRRIALIDLADLEDPDGLGWLTDRLGHDPAASVRAEAARLLEAWEEPEVVQALCLALTDPQPEVHGAAAQSLSLLKDVAMGRVILPWTSHADARVRCAAFRALRELRDQRAAEAALLALDDPEAGVRREAVAVLGWLKQTQALTTLSRLLAHDPDTEVRRAAAGALGMASEAAVIPALCQALHDAAWQVREEAATTLGKVAGDTAAQALAGDGLLGALHDGYWQVRLRATRSLGRLRYGAALSALIETLQHSISNLRKEAALALGELGNPDAIGALQAAEQDGDPEVRKAVRIALAQIAAAVPS
ncbi:HEAT repeat domain-containing protein [Pseudomonas sp. 21LCFQ02]|uniref:HEAT repeat domain-containing protein n=1 Tax=Pseudomonas sp. 21LCFQ02 TaxID=2957505 RepID=UPI00209AA87D|nr:HEAT repeat domain-containing protein [Pseudomonas sp. 21LCFQ02]MCO8169121.1 HEAT repeat domain-containing protein [Pseudomonas sp. 21LCFQ02]